MAIARRLALGRLVSLTGGSAAYIALVAAIYGETGSAVWVSSALFASVVASVASAPFAGWLGDRHDRRGVLIGADLAAAAASCAMALTGQPEALVPLLGLSSVAQSPFGPASAAALPLSLELRGGTEGYGAMTALLGGGGVLGAALAGRVLAAGPSRVLVGAFAGESAGLALAGTAPVLTIGLGGMALSGIGRGLGDVAATTLLQTRAPDEVRSRVFAAEEGAAHLAFTMSALTGGLIVELLGARGAFAVAAAFGVGALLLALRIGPDS